MGGALGVRAEASPYGESPKREGASRPLLTRRGKRPPSLRETPTARSNKNTSYPYGFRVAKGMVLTPAPTGFA
jgi:hypothetical protein